MKHHDDLDRRQILRGAGVLGLGAAAGLGITPSLAAAPASLLAGSCTLTAGQIQGPFYRDLNLVRQDITEGLPGIPRLYETLAGFPGQLAVFATILIATLVGI